MYALNSNFHQYNYSTSRCIVANSPAKTHCSANSACRNFDRELLSFTSANPNSSVRTNLVSKEEKNKYKLLTNSVGKDYKRMLHNMLKTGVLLNSDSNNHSTVLDNLYNMAVIPRADGLNQQVVLEAAIKAVSNPYSITQLFGDVPLTYMGRAIDLYRKDNKNYRPSNLLDRKIADYNININHSGTCVAASIEFNLAHQHPAEFTRFAEGLSSKKMFVDKKIKLNNLADNTLDAVWLLNAFEIPYEANDFNEAKLTFKPDKNAIFRAQIQTKEKEPLERSVIDVLMQSTFMQVGSQQSYDTLTDKRKGKFNQNDKGLIEFEKTFTESVVEDKNKISVTYQTVDENARLIGYETDFNTMKNQIMKSLEMGENVIIGYTQVDRNNIIINGHEITIIGSRKDDKGKVIFICNDTDDNITGAIEYPQDFLLPKIHHAALPHKVVEQDVKLVENWVEGLKTYKELKKSVKLT